MTSQEVRMTSSRYALRTRWGTATPADAAAVTTARIAEYVTKLVAAAPPLSPAQKARLASLLSGDGEQEQQHDADLEDLDGGDAA